MGGWWLLLFRTQTTTEKKLGELFGGSPEKKKKKQTNKNKTTRHGTDLTGHSLVTDLTALPLSQLSLDLLMQVIEADLTYVNERFERGVKVVVNPEGIIEAVLMPEIQLAPRPSSPVTTLRLHGQALLPGMIDAHSHAFQRGLRGLADDYDYTTATGSSSSSSASSDSSGTTSAKEAVAASPTDSFWSWREAMYALVSELQDRDRFVQLCRQTFCEMRRGGITSVGEFHYLHHSAPERQDFVYDLAVLDAAHTEQIRIVLLQACYRRAGFVATSSSDDEPALSAAQQRFDTISMHHYWTRLDQLAALVADRPTQSVGVVAHSLRAVSAEDVAQLYRGALQRRLVMHLHLEEQQKEIDDCRAAHGGKTPMRLLLDTLIAKRVDPSMLQPTASPSPSSSSSCSVPTASSSSSSSSSASSCAPPTASSSACERPFSNLTAVHCTHSDPKELAEFLSGGGHVCVCPLTEAHLGDGIPQLEGCTDGVNVCLGSDCNARICMAEEMRWLEYAQRLRTGRRGVCVEHTTRKQLATQLFRYATEGGALALGLAAGRIEPGRLADFFTLDLSSDLLRGWTEHSLLGSFVFGCSAREVVARTCVHGRWFDSSSCIATASSANTPH